MTPEQRRKNEAIFFLSSNFHYGECVRIVTKSRQNEKGKWFPASQGKIFEVGALIDAINEANRVEDVFKDFNPQAGAWISINPTKGSTDQDVTAYRNILIECDDIPIDEQLRLIKELNIPYFTLVNSGKRSIHALTPVWPVEDEATYRRVFEFLCEDLKAKGFPIDTANGNPSRLTRLPGVPRGEVFQTFVGEGKNYIEVKSFLKEHQKKEIPSNKSTSPQKTNKLGNGLELCRRALCVIDPVSLDYDEWYKISVAWKNEGGSYEEWLEWCQRDPQRAIGLEKKWKDLLSKNFRGRPLTGAYITKIARRFDPNFARKGQTDTRRKANSEDEEENEFNFIEQAKICLDLFHAIRLNEDILYIWTSEGFTCNPNTIDAQISSMYNGDLRPNVVKELHSYLNINAPSIKEADKKYIQFNNGILDTKTKAFLPLSPDLFIRQRIPWNYNPEAIPVEIVDKVLNEWACGDEQTKILMLEWAGYQLLRYTPIAAFMLIIGPKRNGKSAYCEWLRELVGYANSSSVPMKDLEERFKTAVFYDKLSNIADENKGTYMSEIPLLKAISAGGYIDVEPKGQDSFTVRCTTKCTFAFNQDFTVDDRSGALKARMKVMCFNANFSDESKQDHSLLSKLTEPEAMEYFIKLAVEALFELLERGRFTLPEQSAQWLEEQDLLNNPMRLFFKEVSKSQIACTEDGEILEGADLWTSYPASVLYSAYCQWCFDNDWNLWTQTKFGREIQKKLELEKVRCWEKGPFYGKLFYSK